MPTTIELPPGTETSLRKKAERHGQSAESYLREFERWGAKSDSDQGIVLLTGFEPFRNHKMNPSQQVAERLHGEIIGGARVVGLTLPVVYGEDTARVFAAITDIHPTLVLSLGLWAGAACLEVERFAVNSRLRELGQDAQEPILTDGPAAYFATVDAERIAQAIRERAQVPARAHGYAGAYLCNHILYQTLHFAETNALPLKAGFIHLPLSSEQIIGDNELHRPSLPLEIMATGIRTAIEEAIR